MTIISDDDFSRFKSIDPKLREPTMDEIGEGKYGGGFEQWDRAAEIFSMESDNLPDGECLRGIDWSDPLQALREVQLAYAGGWAVGEYRVALFLEWLLKSRSSAAGRAILEHMVAGAPASPGVEEQERSLRSFEIAPFLAQLILELPEANPAEESKSA